MNNDLTQNLIQRVSLGDIFRRKAATSPDKIAVVEMRGENNIELSYKELNSKLNNFVYMARELGLRKGDRIALLGPNSIEYLICLYGCAKGGFVALPINPGLSPDGIAYILKHAEAKALICDDDLCPLVLKVNGLVPELKTLVSFSVTTDPVKPPFKDLNKLMEGKSDQEIEDVIIRDRDVFQILYTSGTTADPKGVMISHLSVFILSLTNPIELDWQRKTVLLSTLPVFHCAQQTFNTSAFHLGGKVVIFRSFEPNGVIQAIEREKIQVLFCLPVMYRAMLDCPAIKNSKLSSVRTCLYAMTPMDRRTLEESIEMFKADFMLVTGQTECFPSTNTFRPEWQLKKEGNYWGESALTVDTAIMDASGNLLPSGTVGEIVWRGPGVMEMYLKNPEATNSSREYAWHHSGDLGYFDEDGLLVFVDRKKDMIKTGGENVPSIKIERIILNHPEVEAVAVVGLPHERWIEAITAFVVTVQNSDLTEADILSLCKEHLGGFEVPKRVVFVDELPKTTTGKLEKYKIRNQFSDLYKRA
jgi:long-chain acyl-CoA synthetase